jgi:hypothetical protein
VVEVEAATINADSTLGPFADIGLRLAPRLGSTVVVAGDHLYVIGGSSDGSSQAVQLDATGRPTSVTTLAADAASTGFPFPFAGSAVIGSWVYLIGGTNFTGVDRQVVQRAALLPDGKLGPLMVVPEASLIFPRHAPLVVVRGETLYVIGGDAWGSVESATIRADGSLGPFGQVAGAKLPYAASGVAGATLGNAIYVIGGNQVQTATVDGHGTLSPVQVLPDTQLRAARSGASTATIGNQLYVIGGYDERLREHPGVEHATINVTSWVGPFSLLPLMPAKQRYSQLAIVVGRWLHLIGGGTDLINGYVERSPIGSDGSLGTFELTNGTLVENRYHACSAVAGNYIYAIAGLDLAGSAFTRSIERATVALDGTIGAFAKLPVQLEQNHNDQSCFIRGDRLYVVGGNADGSIEMTTIAADGSLAPFTTLATKTPADQHYSVTVALLGDILYLVGAGTDDDVAGSVTQATFKSDGTLSDFTPASGLQFVPSVEHTSLVVGTRLMTFGGVTAADGPPHSQAAPILAGDVLGSFDFLDYTATQVDGASVTELGNWVYLIGGLWTEKVGRAELIPSDRW